MPSRLTVAIGCMSGRYMVDVILAYEDDGNMVGLDFADGGLKLQSYREGKKHVPTCCVGRIREDLDSENGLR